MLSSSISLQLITFFFFIKERGGILTICQHLLIILLINSQYNFPDFIAFEVG